jgi:hypothetical protein
MRHQDRVYAATFDAKGERVVTASFDNTARIWDARTGEPIGKPLQHQRRSTPRASATRVPLQAGGLGAGGRVPQPDRFIPRARGKPPVRQHAQRHDPTRVPLQAGGSHSRIVSSLEPEASRPSGSTHSAATKPECPSRRAVSAPVVGLPVPFAAQQLRASGVSRWRAVAN